MNHQQLQKERNLHKELEKQHNASPFSTYLKEIVYGGNDGIVTTFAVVAGFAGAQAAVTNLPIAAVLLFGLANLFADGASMALGNFLSIRADQDIYAKERSIELKEITLTPEHEIAETIAILKKKGYTAKDADQLARLLVKNPQYWSEFMMQDEHGLSNPEGDNPWLSAVATFLSFIAFGFIPLVPYLIPNQVLADFNYSVLFTLTALVTLGFLRYRVTRISLVRSVLEVIALGGSAALIAYLVGTFFRI